MCVFSSGFSKPTHCLVVFGDDGLSDLSRKSDGTETFGSSEPFEGSESSAGSWIFECRESLGGDKTFEGSEPFETDGSFVGRKTFRKDLFGDDETFGGGENFGGDSDGDDGGGSVVGGVGRDSQCDGTTLYCNIIDWNPSIEGMKAGTK